ncbi:MAG: thiamine pyrophosphate-binding protein, partial [Pseudomonadota bacterium]
MERPHIFKNNSLTIPSNQKPSFISEMIEINLAAPFAPSTAQLNFEEKSFEFNVQTCADLITFYLTELGFNTVFGVPGGNIDPLFASMNTLHELNFLEIINPLHEAAGIFMADGFYRETGKLSLVCATSGPGATNLITGVVSAYEQHIPMLIITAQPPISDHGRHAWQEMSCTTSNIVNMMKECCRYSTLVSHPEQLEYKLLTSLAYALGPSGGPVHLSIPRDILKASIKLKFSKRRDIIESIQKKSFPLDAIMFHELYSKIQLSKSGTFVLGERAGGAVFYAEKLAKILGWSIVTTPAAKGLIDYRHPNFLGVVGMAGHAQAIAALHAEQSELLIALGMTFNEMTTLNWNESNLFSQRLISIESNPDIQAQFFNAQLQILSNPAVVLRALYERLSTPSTQTINPVNTTFQNPIWITEQKPYQKIHPGALMEYLSEAAPLDCRLSVDIGNSMLWAVQAWRFRRS